MTANRAHFGADLRLSYRGSALGRIADQMKLAFSIRPAVTKAST
jgi:hypothetical protein